MRDLLKKEIISNSNNISYQLKIDGSYISNKFNPNIFFDKIFIINLKRSTDRWTKIKINLVENGIYNFERQEGVYLPRINAIKHLNYNLYSNIEAYGKFKKDNNYILNVVGTNLAHYEIIKKSIKRNYNRILILEDDSFINKTFHQNFINGIRYLNNKSWDFIYLGFKRSAPTYNARKVSNEIIIPFNKIRGAYGYAVNSNLFPFLMKNYLYRGMELDVFFEFVLMKRKNVYAFQPQIISHRDKMKSTITSINWKKRT